MLQHTNKSYTLACFQICRNNLGNALIGSGGQVTIFWPYNVSCPWKSFVGPINSQSKILHNHMMRLIFVQLENVHKTVLRWIVKSYSFTIQVVPGFKRFETPYSRMFTLDLLCINVIPWYFPWTRNQKLFKEFKSCANLLLLLLVRMTLESCTVVCIGEQDPVHTFQGPYY